MKKNSLEDQTAKKTKIVKPVDRRNQNVSDVFNLISIVKKLPVEWSTDTELLWQLPARIFGNRDHWPSNVKKYKEWREKCDLESERM